MNKEEIIAEFILQRINQGEAVEIEEDDGSIRGLIVDKDVFPSLPIKLHFDNVLYKANHQQRQVVRIQKFEDKDRTNYLTIAGGRDGVSLYFPFGSGISEIPIGSIKRIKKLTFID